MSRKSKADGPPRRLRESLTAFAAHLRNPERNPPPGDLEDRRLEIYRGLFFRNIRNFLSSNFPVLRKLHDAEAWDRLTREFYDRHRSATPLFPEIPREFLRYLQDEREPREEDPPFMLELAHYEWVELALSLDEEDIDAIPADPEGDLLESMPVLSPLAWPLSYRYPVHRISPEYQPQEAPEQPTHLLVYRTRNDTVKFMSLNPVTLRMVQLLKDSQLSSGLDVLKQLAQEMSHPDPQVVIAGGRQVLQDLRSRDIILGTRPH